MCNENYPCIKFIKVPHYGFSQTSLHLTVYRWVEISVAKDKITITTTPDTQHTPCPHEAPPVAALPQRLLTCSATLMVPPQSAAPSRRGRGRGRFRAKHAHAQHTLELEHEILELDEVERAVAVLVELFEERPRLQGVPLEPDLGKRLLGLGLGLGLGSRLG